MSKFLFFLTPLAVDGTLVAHYLFDGNAQDGSGFANHGTVRGGAVLAVDRHGNADSCYSFNGQDSWIEATNNVASKLTTEMTISAWVKVDGPGLNYPRIITGGSPINRQFSLDRYSADNGYLWRPWARGTRADVVVTKNELELNGVDDREWHHIVGTRDLYTTKFYVDGALLETKSAYGTMPSGRGTWGIGGEDSIHSSGRPTGGQSHLNGKIDDLRVFDEALSLAEVVTLYNDEKFVPDTTSPVLTIPADQDLSCSDDVPAVGQATATDDTDPSPIVSYVGEVNVPGVGMNYDLQRTWSASDVAGNTVSATQTISVADTTAPFQVNGLAKECVWPPNNKFECYDHITTDIVQAEDDCASAVTIAYLGCTSSDGGSDDCYYEQENDRMCYRAQREGGNKDGRSYTAMFSLTDLNGNVGSAMHSVLVPHDSKGCGGKGNGGGKGKKNLRY